MQRVILYINICSVMSPLNDSIPHLPWGSEGSLSNLNPIKPTGQLLHCGGIFQEGWQARRI